MIVDGIARRQFLRAVGASAATLGAMAFAGSGDALAQAAEVSGPDAPEIAKPEHEVRFSVCGMSHDHIFGMVEAMIRGGGKLVGVYAAEPERGAAFVKRYPNAKLAKTEQEVIDDPSIQLILSSAIPNHRAEIGIRAMRAGKDYLADKPGLTTLEQLADVRRTVAATGRVYAIMYSERLEVKAAVKAGYLVRAGAIGKVIQTINIAPHQILQGAGDAGGGTGRPEWFWHPEQYGGILCDIGSHQVDQFLYYTGSTRADLVASQVANVRHPDRPQFQDFGDMMFHGDKGFGYVRLDWFTPKGLGTWGDGRLFILGTEGYIEIRKYADIGAPSDRKGNHLYLVDGKQQRMIDCNNVMLPFGPQFIADVANRTHVAQDQAQCLLAMELVVRAQAGAKHQVIEG
jgi:predicted dehydrogenase